MDVLMGIILVSIIAAMLSIAAGSHERAQRHLVDSRSAARLAESALFCMQSGQTPSPARGSPPKLSSRITMSPAKRGSKSRQQSEISMRTLVGLVPQEKRSPVVDHDSQVSLPTSFAAPRVHDD